MRIRAGSVAAMLFVAIACQPVPVTQSAKSLTLSQRNSIADSVQRAMDHLTAAADRANAPETFALFSRSPDFTSADNGLFYTSADSLQRVYTEVYATIRSQSLVFTQSKIVVLSPAAAIMSGTGTFSAVDLSGAATPTGKFAMSLLWVREPTGWKVLHAHQSFVQPPR
jgi:SnoaL-like protein